ncbi:hypothetical protein NDU88_001475 [Pleurodeles waltl]|uniref:Secreted protein n=1 Tax=Pleurodeles waltl TaxID=8319 RepID=A0AAV7SZA8_PLEWA|nr:hypothetical protein NDU88_001475 [Pleurodeles waltl]
MVRSSPLIASPLAAAFAPFAALLRCSPRLLFTSQQTSGAHGHFRPPGPHHLPSTLSPVEAPLSSPPPWALPAAECRTAPAHRSRPQGHLPGPQSSWLEGRSGSLSAAGSSRQPLLHRWTQYRSVGPPDLVITVLLPRCRINVGFPRVTGWRQPESR